MSLKSVRSKLTSFGLTLALVLGFVSPVFFAQEASAVTAGSGSCASTYTLTGTGTVDVTQDSNYCYLAFKNSGAVNTQATFTWTKPTALSLANVLVIGGGGGGGSRHAGGGGAGAYVEATSYALTTSTVNVVVGAGGAGAVGGSIYKGSSGQNSSFLSNTNGLIALGGGFGSYNETAGSGGSGGGSGWSQTSGLVTTQAQTTLAGAALIGITFGNVGRSGANEPDASYDYWAGGGGGGAGARGENPKTISDNTETTAFASGIASNTRGGAGGIGKAPSWLPTTVATTLAIGEVSGGSVYFAGGGGGGMGNDGVDGGAGGIGGGGKGTKAQKTGGIAATAFTGGGGGSSGFDDINLNTAVDLQNPPGGNGGSGVVVVRYQIQPSAPTITGITGGNGTLSVAFTPTVDFGVTITGYKYSTDGGTTWSASTGTTTSPISISGLTNGTTYQVQLRAVSASWDGVPTASTSGLVGVACSPTVDTSTVSGSTIVKFTTVTDCNWTIPNNLTSIDLLVVGGGGGGGINVGFGGGGGGSYYRTALTVSPGANAAITVGAGGSAGTYIGNTGTASANHNGGNGGSSSIVIGASTFSGAGGSGGKTYWSSNQCAGSTANSGTTSGGVGSGTGGTATTGGTGQPGNTGYQGGAGFSNSISGTSTNYAAGGGGGGWPANFGAAGGASAGAGGNGSGAAGGSATSNLGGGGGGGAVTCGNGGAGGSGVVIIRYVNPPSISLSTSNVNATIGTAISSYSITNTGGTIASYSISPSLPSPLQFDTSTGLISGTPSATSSSTTYTVTATNTSGTGSATFSLASNYPNCSPTSSQSNGYTILKFTSTTTCNWTTPAGITAIEVAVVGGGGGGGFGSLGGGGGAGEVLVSGTASISGNTTSGYSVTGTSTVSATPGAVTVVSVGAGGSSGAPNGTSTASGGSGWKYGGDGSATSFGSITAAGGGGGGGDTRVNGAAGGSGGGGANGGTAGAAGTSSPPSGWTSFRNAGSAGQRGGGGGAAGAGTQASAGAVSSNTSGPGVSIWGIKVAGGGLGWERYGQDTALGGDGRAGTVNYPYYGTSPNYSSEGVAGTGTGGGAGAPGGSGVVIVRYANTYTITYTYNSADGGNGTATSTFTTGGTAITLPVPTRTGYTFGGWYEAADFSGSALGLTYSPTSTRNIYAKWNSYSTDSTLSGLSISSGTLSPNFVGSTTTYTASVANGTSSITVTPTRNQANATIQIKIGSGSYATVASGSASSSLSLAVGTNLITVLVTAQDGTTTSTYTVTVSRLPVVPTLTLYTAQVLSYRSSLVPDKPVTSLMTANYSVTYGRYQSVQFKVNATTTDAGVLTWNIKEGTNCASSATDISGATGLTINTTKNIQTWNSSTCYLIEVVNTLNGVTSSLLSTYQFLPNYTATPTRINGTVAANDLSGTVGQTYSNATPYSVSGGGGSWQYFFVNAYPAGLSINSTTGIISGIFTSAGTGNATYIGGIDANGASAVIGPITWTVSDAALTVTYNSQGGSSVTAGTVNTGASITSAPTAPTKAGYTLSGWSATSNGSVVTFPYAHGQIANFTLYAIWSANALTITYDSQGGSAVTSGSVNTGASISAAPTDPTKSGYTFTGWATTNNGSVVTFPYAHGQTANFTLYAIWSANGNAVVFNNNSGTGTMANQSIVSGSATTLSLNTFTRSGYTFNGWNTNADGTSGTSYTDGQSVTITAGMTLYAKWTGNTNTVTYDSKGGSSVSNGSFVTGSSIASAPTAPTKAGYTLTGWSATDGGSAITFPYSPGATAGITLYALWNAISCSPTSVTSGGYTIYTFTTAGTCFWTVPNGVSAVEVLVVGAGGGGGYAYDNTGAGGGAGGQVKTGFATLSTTETITVGSGGVGGSTGSRRGGTGNNSVAGGITALGGTGGCGSRSSCADSAQATALAAANGGAGGGGGVSGKGGGGSNVTASATTTTAGGAGTSSNYSGSAVTYGTGGTGGVPRGLVTSTNIPGAAASANTGNGGGGASAKSSSGDVNGGDGGSGLVIIRVASALTITYDSQSGSAVSDGSTLTGGTISSAPTAPTRSTYTFLGWFTATSGGSAISFPYAHGQTANFTLYAHWSLNTYAITFNGNNGSGTMGNQTVTHGVAAGLNANLFTRANYVFYRWSTAADGSGTTYDNLSQITLTSGITLYAQWTANTYVVTFNYDNATGGASTNTSSFTTGGSAITMPTPTKSGYTFAGWYSDSALTASIGAAGSSYSPTGTTLSLNAYAKWTPINYTFTYSDNNSDSGTVPTETTKQITQTATVKANTGSLVRGGYTFSGWNTSSDGTGTTYLSGAIFTVGSSNVTLYAKWSANTYTITYNTNGGTGNAQRSASNVTSDSYTTGGSSITLPSVGTLQRSGYTFSGWNTSANGTGTDYSAAATYTTVSNVTFYAKWTAVTYSITYNGNTSNGGSAPATGSYTTGQASPYSVLNNSYTKTSNVFGGWNTAADGSGTSYSPGSTITTLADMTLYATWIPQYTLHYAVNGGTVSSGSLPADQLYNTGTVVGPVFSSMSRTGYTFDGWTNGAATIAPGGNFTITADSVLTAKWTAINYTISYNSDGGTDAPAQITKQIGQSHTVGSSVTKPGYNFAGWSNGSSVVGPGATIVTGASDVTYTAQWTPKVYQVSYDWNGGRGTAVSDVAYTFGTPAITLPTVGDRVKDGYTFSGWSESQNGSVIGATYTPSQSRTLYAQWALGNFTVTYDAGRGTVANSTVQVQNGSATTLPLPTRANFVFDGWHTANTGGTKLGSNGDSFTPSSSQTVYARWIQSSLYGISNSLSRIGSVITSSNIANTFTGANSNSSVSVSVPANAFEAGTSINFDLVGNSSRAVGLLPNVNYLVSIAVSWLTGNETVPETAAGKPISITISNPTIKAGAAAYAIVNNVSTLLGTATQDGTITVSITSDPEIVIAATKPGAPTSVSATSNGNQQSVISWSAPSSDGGSAITGYTVTSNTGATCTTSTTSCTISSLTNGTAYSFTVTATNTVGTSVASTSASATTASVYTVAFDAKGGSAVTSGTFLTAGTVAEPTAPTKSGYAFAGWATTDGGSAEVFPYAPGVTSNITMYARWDALDHVVTFDSNGGSTVSDGTFSSGGSVAQPTAPTKSGYTFAGWSATNGGSVVTFPYSPGVVTDITLYAKWTAVSSGGGSGSSSGGSSNSGSSSSSNSNSGNSSAGGAATNSNIAVLPPVTVTGSSDTKIPSIQLIQPGSSNSQSAPTVKIDAASDKFIADVKIVDGALVLTPEVGFSGKKTVTVTINQDGLDKVVMIPITVLPEAVTAPVVTPTSTSKTVIKWSESPNATSYTVYVNGKKACTTAGSSCAISNILGPKADVTVVSNGGDKTASQHVDADFTQTKPVQVTRLVSSTSTKSSFTKTDISALNKLVSLVKSQGFGTVVISQIATTAKNQKAADARIEAIKKFISDKVGAKNVDFEITPPSSKTIFNNIAVKG